MYSVYLVEELNIPNPSAKHSGTNDINLTTANTVNILKIDNVLSLEVGDYIKINDEFYPIVSFSYNSYFRYYSIQVEGNPAVGYYTGLYWSIYSKTKQTNYVKLDTEDTEIETTFAVADISDISKRPDTITKNITLKGTEENNKAFGHLFNLNRSVDLKKPNKLFFNYSPLRTVDCLIYEDSVLILRGNMMITEYNVDGIGLATYQATVTGKRIDFKNALGDALLSDLNLVDLKHDFNPIAVINSWGGALSSPPSGYTSVGFSQTQRYNPATITYYNQAFQAGSGYVYPFIDYGETFKKDTFNNDYSWIKSQNFRPALFVREYYNRIFSRIGYTYELKGSTEFIERFNHLIVPNNEEWFNDFDNANPSEYRFYSPFYTFPISSPYAMMGTQDHASNRIDMIDEKILYHPLRVPNPIGVSRLTKYGPEFGSLNRTNNILQCTRKFTTDGYVKVKLRKIYNDSSTHDSQITIQFVKREYSNNDMNVSDWDIIAQDSFTIAKKATMTEKTIEFLIPKTEFNTGDQVMVRLTQSVGLTNIGSEYYPIYTISSCQFNISEVALKLPKNLSGNEYYNYEVMIGDKIVPRPPADFKQIDFLKSVHTLLNAYVSSDPTNPKHFVIQSYDDFYAFTNPGLLKTTALNWTSKVDYSKGYKGKSNITIPKNYVFSYKEDSDYINALYKDKYGEGYSTLKFSDSLGFTDAQKIEVAFSPSPQIEIGNAKRVYPILAKDGITLGQKSPTKVNPRILYYNGVRNCSEYSITDDFMLPDGTWTVRDSIRTTWYGQVSMYWYDKAGRNKNGSYPESYVPLHSLDFNNPKEYYFSATSAYNSVPTLYSQYYINQISELTNPNIFTFQCEVLLTEHEIGMLDLRVPVYIDTGSSGNAYFKVLSIDYSNNKRTSTVTLQKILYIN